MRLHQFDQTIRIIWSQLLYELPFSWQAGALHIRLKAKRDCDRHRSITFADFRGCIAYCAASHHHQHPLITMYQDPILQTTNPDRVLKTIRGILIHECCHWIGLDDQGAWAVGEDAGWCEKALRMRTGKSDG